MKKRFRLIVLFWVISLVITFRVNNSYASSEEATVNPIFEEILSEEQKDDVQDELEGNISSSSSNVCKYKGVIYTNYNALVKEVQNNLIKRKEQFTVSYRTTNKKLDLKKFMDVVINDAMSEKYATSPILGDYLAYSIPCWKSSMTYNKNDSYIYCRITYYPLYFTSYKQEQELNKKIDKFFSQYNAKVKTKYEIIYDLNNYICENVEYFDNDDMIQFSAYSAMVKKEAVCQGYATLYYRLLKECGINSRIVSSEEINHAWNAVEYNKKWYMVDTTWNDTLYSQTRSYSSYGYHSFFMKSVSDFKSHGSLKDVKPKINELNYTKTSLNIEANRFNIKNVAAQSETSYEDIKKGKMPKLKLTYTGTVLKLNQDYKIKNIKVVNDEKAVVTVEGMYKFKGTKNISVLKKSNLKECKMSIAVNKTYTGTTIKPTVTVKYENTTLKNGKDYILSYKNNTNVGTAAVTIKGKGNYTGSKSTTFKIVAKPIEGATISKISNQAYTGNEIKPKVTVTIGKKKLKKGVDYTVSYKNNKKIGTAKVIIKGKGNYIGTVNKTFKIKAIKSQK